MSTATLSGGDLDWSALRSRFDGATFTWQDLDGVHQCLLPGDAPATSLLHGWSSDGTTLVRVRLEGERALHAAVQLGGDVVVDLVVPDEWGDTARVAQVRTHDGSTIEALAQVELADTGAGALVFLVPKRLSAVWA